MRDAEEVLHELARVVESVPEEGADSLRRERLAAQIQLMARRERAASARRRRLRLSTVVAAAGVFLAAAGGALFFSSQKVRAGSQVGEVASLNGAGLQGPLTHLGVTRLASGAELTVSGPVDYAISHRAEGALAIELLELRSGKVSFEVPPLGAYRRLRVQTPEALVEVRGTGFSVERNAMQHWTRVEVRHGLVSVSQAGAERLLATGEFWQGGVEPSSPSTNALRRDDVPAVEAEVTSESVPKDVQAKDSVSARAPALAHETAESAARSRLAEENRLYQMALQARRSGMNQLCRERLEELLRRSPNSPLASLARHELARLNEDQPNLSPGEQGR